MTSTYAEDQDPKGPRFHVGDRVVKHGDGTFTVIALRWDDGQTHFPPSWVYRLEGYGNEVAGSLLRSA